MKNCSNIETLRQKLAKPLPLFLSAFNGMIVLEMKPYLQPFEKTLAILELKALLNNEDDIHCEQGYYIVKNTQNENHLKRHLTYWQRIGLTYLEPTSQKLIEYTQNGFNSTRGAVKLHQTRRLRYGPHDIHEYRGKFFPQLVRSLINISGIKANSLILDPMCGSGTTLCEAIASEHSVLGVDLNPLSILISKVKSTLVLEKPKDFQKNVTGFVKSFDPPIVALEKKWSTHDLEYLTRWFDLSALKEVASVLGAIDKVKNNIYREFYLVSLSNILRSVSWQKESDLRVRKEEKKYTSGIVYSKFIDQVNDQLNKIYPYLCVLPELSITPSIEIREGNAVAIDEIFSHHEKQVDLLITSPPYATALPYLDTDRLSLVALGLLPRTQHRIVESQMVGTREVSEKQRQHAWEYYQSRKNELPQCVSLLIDKIAQTNHGEEIGFRRRNLPALLAQYFINMLDAMRSAHKLMKQGALAYYIVGNNSTTIEDEKFIIPTDQLMIDIGRAAGWRPIESISMELLNSRDIFRNNRGSAEVILSFTA